MAFAVRDYVQAGRPIPADTQPPAAGSPLFDYLVRRLINSFDVPGGVATSPVGWCCRRDLRLFFGSVRGTFARTVLSTWPQVKSDIDGGQLSPLGLVTVHSPTFAAVGSEIGKCHQVLAYAYRLGDDGTVAISVYDPNTARATADDVHITMNIATPGTPSPITHNINIAEPTLHGFFRSRYSPAVPPA